MFMVSLGFPEWLLSFAIRPSRGIFHWGLVIGVKISKDKVFGLISDWLDNKCKTPFNHPVWSSQSRKHSNFITFLDAGKSGKTFLEVGNKEKGEKWNRERRKKETHFCILSSDLHSSPYLINLPLSTQINSNCNLEDGGTSLRKSAPVVCS